MQNGNINFNAEKVAEDRNYQLFAVTSLNMVKRPLDVKEIKYKLTLQIARTKKFQRCMRSKGSQSQ